MASKCTRLVLVGMIMCAWMIGFIHTPGAVRGASDDNSFSSAETVLSQSGTLGHWWLPQPPGFPPLKCMYPVDSASYRHVNVVGPYVYPVQGIASQDVRVTLSINRRLPGGASQIVDQRVLTGTVSVGVPGFFGIPGGGSDYPEDLGSTFYETIKIEWFAAPSVVMSHVELLYTQYQTQMYGGSSDVLAVTDACYPVKPATASLGITAGTVGSSIPFTIARFPHDPNVGIYFDGKKIGTVATDLKGQAAGAFIVPAAPMGTHTVKFYRYGRTASVPFTIKPRIKLSPSSGLIRGQSVNVSLRGFAAHETVNVRWIKNGSFVTIGHITTSSTGSANVNIIVPKWVPNGFTSVRGDGSSGHAQTNAVTVVGGPFSSSSLKPTPAATPSPSPSAVRATTTVEPSSTAEPTEQPSTPEITETATAQPTETSTPTIEPTQDPPATELPTVEPTFVPSETPEATSTVA